jgi:hypothetical protein
MMGGGIRKRSEWRNREVREAVTCKRGAYEEWLQKSTSDAFEEYKRERQSENNGEEGEKVNREWKEDAGVWIKE